MNISAVAAAPTVLSTVETEAGAYRTSKVALSTGFRDAALVGSAFGPQTLAAPATTALDNADAAALSELHSHIAAQAAATHAISAIAVAAQIARPVTPLLVDPQQFQAQPAIRDFVLYGDSGLLIQSNNAAESIGRLVLPPIYATRTTPAVPPVEAVVSVGKRRKIDAFA
jgi:hypothetical protein